MTPWSKDWPEIWATDMAEVGALVEGLALLAGARVTAQLQTGSS